MEKIPKIPEVPSSGAQVNYFNSIGNALFCFKASLCGEQDVNFTQQLCLGLKHLKINLKVCKK